MAFLFRLCALALLLQPTGLIADPDPHPLAAYRDRAAAVGLPTRLIDDLVAADVAITVRRGDAARYFREPGEGGILELPSGPGPETWTSTEWILFYHEAFHAWWEMVFPFKRTYTADRIALAAPNALTWKYRRANPLHPEIAQEEGYGETIGALVLLLYPRPTFDPATRRTKREPMPFERLAYRQGWTAAPVSHGDRPGYTEAAESTFLDEREYALVFRWLTGRLPPKPQRSLDLSRTPK